MIRFHRYTITHALAASAALGVVVFSQGFAQFWQQFVYGLNHVMTPRVLFLNLMLSTILFGSLIVIIWAAARFFGGNERVGQNSACESAKSTDRRYSKSGAIKLALVAAPLMTIVALVLNWGGANVIEWVSGVKPSDQELVKCFTDGHYSFWLKSLMCVSVMLEAPLLEEPIFRGIIFRGFATAMPKWCAMLLSGFVFAFAHVNASSFVALWFLGIGFAYLYVKSGSILAPITAHLAFNSVNLLLLFL